MSLKKFDFLIIAGGVLPPRFFLKKLSLQANHIITVDSGVSAAVKLKIRPLLHVGDNDSASEGVIVKAWPKIRITLPPKKSISDLEYALNELPGEATKLVVGAHRDSEGRMDHVFVNLILATKHPKTYFVDERMWITSISGPASFSFSVLRKTLFTVVSLGGGKVDIQGAAYNVKNDVLKIPSQGLSNLALKKPVRVRAQRPALLFVSTSILKTRLS